MSNGARHGLGVLAGLACTPVILALLLYGTERMGRVFLYFRMTGSDRWLAAALLALAAVLIGLLAGSRISPVAALIPGLLLTANGLAWVLAPRWSTTNFRDLMPSRSLDRAYSIVGVYGVLLVLGLVLLVSALPPSRWRAARPRGAMAPQQAPQQAPYGLPPGPPRYDRAAGAPQQQQQQGVPPYDPSARPYGAPPSPPPLPSTPQQPQPQSQGPQAQSHQGPSQPSSGSQPGSQHGSQQGDDDEPGEWTRMYGGGGRQS